MSKLQLRKRISYLLKLARAKANEQFKATTLKARDEKRFEVLTLTPQELQLFDEMGDPIALEETLIYQYNSKAAILSKTAKDKILRKSQRVLNKYKKKREAVKIAEAKLLVAKDAKEIKILNQIILNNTLTAKELEDEEEILWKRQDRALEQEKLNIKEKSFLKDPFNTGAQDVA